MSTRPEPATVQELWQQELDEHGPHLPLLLEPEENIRGIVRTDFGWLVKNAPERHLSTEKGFRRFLDFLSAISGFESSDVQPIKRVLGLLPGTKPLSGGWKGAAGQFVIAATRASYPLRRVFFVVTDRRVIALGTRYDTPLAQQKVAGEYSRDQLTLRAGAPRRPGKGVDIAFPDGTWVRMGGKQLPDELLARLLSE
ncbi:hypothetical protein ABIA33_005499 [Streptacidiphilus sp. MAP12-16]|uniref:hypothetical protein n=1 Tax=Streptacidiphilus sp. MAP12-16 TaxID=3156300 RepID=UPI003513080C